MITGTVFVTGRKSKVGRGLNCTRVDRLYTPASVTKRGPN